MAADALATLGAKASTGMVMTLKAWIFRLQHLKSYDLSSLLLLWDHFLEGPL